MNRYNTFLISLLFSLLVFSQENSAFSFRSLPYLQCMTNTGVTIISIASKPSLSYERLGESANLYTTYIRVIIEGNKMQVALYSWDGKLLDEYQLK